MPCSFVASEEFYASILKAGGGKWWHKRQGTGSSETFVPNYQTTWRRVS
jgi:hypothetical protein